LLDPRDAVTQYGSIRKAAAALGLPASTLQGRLAKAPDFTREELPSALAPVEDLIERRKKEFARVDAAKTARKLINVKVHVDGPFGIAHFGDPHVDDPGTDIAKLEAHLRLVRDTDGLLAANVGDQQNLWVGRLGRLYGEQSTSAKESWALTEWLITYVEWLYLIDGNHDVWTGANDPLKWIMRAQNNGVHEAHGARLNLICPNGRQVRINARHDFPGNSMWNTVHGAAKAAQMGWRDHILTCGHKHTSGYMPVVDPASGLISHCIRVAAYKTHDRYADQLGLPDQNFSENMVTIINPDAKAEVELVTVLFSLEQAADYLTWLRNRPSVSSVATRRRA
jgi:hypothetical protein